MAAGDDQTAFDRLSVGLVASSRGRQPVTVRRGAGDHHDSIRWG